MKTKINLMYLMLIIAIITSCSNPVELDNPQQKTTTVQDKPKQEVNKIKTLPDKFFVKEKVISFVTAFTIEDDNTKYGEVTREIFKLKTTFSYTDVNDNLIMKGEEQILSWGTKIDFYDAEDNYIGAIHENVFESLFSVYSKWNSRAASGAVSKSKRLLKDYSFK